MAIGGADMDADEFRESIENEIRSILRIPNTPLLGLASMNAYHLGFCDRDGKPVSNSKGKYLRPALCLAICAGLGADPEKALPAAASLELIHRTTLIFDDIQDVGKERNGEPTMWTLWGENQAINAGLQLSCFARLAAHKTASSGVPIKDTLRIMDVLENTVIELCEGQYLDLSFMEALNIGVDDYLRMARGKTGALFGSACQIGVICAGDHPDRERIAWDLGTSLGVAFQAYDDYLGVWGEETQTGKTSNDLVEKKRSLPVVLALSRYPDQMGKWLQLPEITPGQADTMRYWMDNVGIRRLTRDEAEYYIRRAHYKLSELELEHNWYTDISHLITTVIDRIK
jgi:geranylgeranyl diphosphate synthase type I